MFERLSLMNFVTPNFSADAKALLVDSEEYLPPLKKLMPNAQFSIETLETLPNSPKNFDVIIADDLLNDSRNTYGVLAEMRELLKDSGFLLTQFFNARFIGMLESLRRGKFPTHEQKFWAKWDVVKLLNDAYFKEIHFLPEEKVDADIDDWINFGFDNFSDDLITKIWLVKACRSTEEVAALKELFSEDVRAELSRLLHRIDSNIDVEENFTKVVVLCRREKIFKEYFFDFVAQVVTHEDARKFLMDNFRS